MSMDVTGFSLVTPSVGPARRRLPLSLPLVLLSFAAAPRFAASYSPGTVRSAPGARSRSGVIAPATATLPFRERPPPRRRQLTTWTAPVPPGDPVAFHRIRNARAMAGAASEIYSDAPPRVGVSSPPSASLASDYVVRVTQDAEEGDGPEFAWYLHPIEGERLAGCPGAAAVGALRTPASEDDDGAAATVLLCRVERSGDGAASIAVISECDGDDDYFPSDGGADSELVSALGCVMVQWAAARSLSRTDCTPDASVTVSLPGAAAKLTLSLEDVLGNNPAKLFGVDKKVEMSEMVDAAGERLGAVPRPLVHKFNVLHRGVGIVVSRDEHIVRMLDTTAPSTPLHTPEVYCHRRTDTKRIFPSMYDMFVGGVSTAGERPALTAAREVAEEYGLKRAVGYLEGETDEGGDALSDPLFKCTVCTSYNRCVVTVFTYRYRTDLEAASWQEEEVAWGDFVPYPIVERAARMDIDRLKEEGEWPGTGYSEVPTLTDETVDEVTGAYGDGGWREWRFVPDGLLVWESWVAWRDGGARFDN